MNYAGFPFRGEAAGKYFDENFFWNCISGESQSLDVKISHKILSPSLSKNSEELELLSSPIDPSSPGRHRAL